MLMSIVVWAQVAVLTHVMSYDVDWDRLGRVEPPVQGRLRPIFVNNVELPDIHEYCAS